MSNLRAQVAEIVGQDTWMHTIACPVWLWSLESKAGRRPKCTCKETAERVDQVMVAVDKHTLGVLQRLSKSDHVLKEVFNAISYLKAKEKP